MAKTDLKIILDEESFQEAKGKLEELYTIAHAIRAETEKAFEIVEESSITLKELKDTYLPNRELVDLRKPRTLKMWLDERMKDSEFAKEWNSLQERKVTPRPRPTPPPPDPGD